MPTGIGNEVAWWCPSLDDTGNGTLTFYDLIASGINGSLNNGETGDWIADTTNGGVRCITLDGANERGLIADDSRFSFGNGATDSAFSVSIWAYSTTLNAVWISKASNVRVGEWYIIVGGTGQLFLRLVDQSTTGFIGRTSAAGTITINTWTHVCATYDGSGSVAGIKIFKNGSRVDNANDIDGVYAAMENTSEPVTIGSRGSATYLSGRWDDARIFNVDLSGVSGAITSLASQRGYQPASTVKQTRRRRSTMGAGIL